MEQHRKDDRSVSRAIKRDHIKHVEQVQGKAGLRLNNTPSDRTVEGSHTSEEAPTSHVRTRRTSPTESRSLNRTDDSETRSAGRTDTSDTRRSPTQVDIAQLVADMKLLDKQQDSSDDEPESFV